MERERQQEAALQSPQKEPDEPLMPSQPRQILGHRLVLHQTGSPSLGPSRILHDWLFNSIFTELVRLLLERRRPGQDLHKYGVW